MSQLLIQRWSKGPQLRSFSIAVTLEVYLQSLVAHLAALLWTASSPFLDCFHFIYICSGVRIPYSVLDLGLISIASLGPRASTKVESHVNFTESQKVSDPNFLQF